MHKNYFLLTVITIMIAVLGAIYAYSHYRDWHPFTDDASVQRHRITLASQVTGSVKKVFVKNGDKVKKGDPIFELDRLPFEEALHIAEATFAQVKLHLKSQIHTVNIDKALILEKQASLALANTQLQRLTTLAKKHYVSKSQQDEAAHKQQQAQLALNTAKQELQRLETNLGSHSTLNNAYRIALAKLNLAKFHLKNTRILAAEEGQIIHFNLYPGSLVTANQALGVLVTSHHPWIVANFKETQLAHIKPHQKASITVDMYPNQVFLAKVDRISTASSSSFALLPTENTTGNWVKVTQRFPVILELITPNPHYPLLLGASCRVSIDTTTSIN